MATPLPRLHTWGFAGHVAQVVAGGALQHDRQVVRQMLAGHARAAQADFLHGRKHARQLAAVSVLQRMQQRQAAHAVVQRAADDAVVAHGFQRAVKDDIGARRAELERLFPALGADVDVQVVMAQHAALILGGLQMDGLGADNARDALFAAPGRSWTPARAGPRRPPAHSADSLPRAPRAQSGRLRPCARPSSTCGARVSPPLFCATRLPMRSTEQVAPRSWHRRRQERANFLLAAGHAERRRQLLQ